MGVWVCCCCCRRLLLEVDVSLSINLVMGVTLMLVLVGMGGSEVWLLSEVDSGGELAVGEIIVIPPSPPPQMPHCHWPPSSFNTFIFLLLLLFLSLINPDSSLPDPQF